MNKNIAIDEGYHEMLRYLSFKQKKDMKKIVEKLISKSYLEMQQAEISNEKTEVI